MNPMDGCGACVCVCVSLRVAVATGRRFSPTEWLEESDVANIAISSLSHISVRIARAEEKKYYERNARHIYNEWLNAETRAHTTREREIERENHFFPFCISLRRSAGGSSSL